MHDSKDWLWVLKVRPDPKSNREQYLLSALKPEWASTGSLPSEAILGEVGQDPEPTAANQSSTRPSISQPAR